MPVVWGLLGFLGKGSLYKHKRISLGKKWCFSDRGVSRMECNNRMSSTSLDAENNQHKNCIMLGSCARSLSSEIESWREKMEKVRV